MGLSFSANERAKSANNYLDGTFQEILEPRTIADGTRRSQHTMSIINSDIKGNRA